MMMMPGGGGGLPPLAEVPVVAETLVTDWGKEGDDYRANWDAFKLLPKETAS